MMPMRTPVVVSHERRLLLDSLYTEVARSEILRLTGCLQSVPRSTTARAHQDRGKTDTIHFSRAACGNSLFFASSVSTG